MENPVIEVSRESDRSAGAARSRWEHLEARAQRVRQHILRMAGRGGCFVGASLSAVEQVVYLYGEWLQGGPEDPNRDRFFLSKGHDVPALYGTLVEMGELDESRLEAHLKTSDSIYWHPNRKIPRVEFHSGSLGHLLSVAVGTAMHAKMAGLGYRTVVLLGDGELNEGSNWEALLVASAYKLDNLILLIDRNQFQANFATEELIPLEPLADKLRAFGASVESIDGHSFSALHGAMRPGDDGRPLAVIARTVRGKGVPSLEGRSDRWFCKFSQKEVESLIGELKGGERGLTNVKGEVVR